MLAAESAATLLERDADAARASRSSACSELARGGDGGAARGGLRAAARRRSRREGLATALRKHVERAAARAPGGRSSSTRGRPAAAAGRGRDAEVFRIAQEALQNALRHAGAERIEVRLEGDGTARLRADGRRRRRAASTRRGARLRARRLGLTSMEERAAELGGTLAIDSAPGEGTHVRLEVAWR